MGKKIPFDIAEKLVGVQENTSIYAARNEYGYKFNVNHPQIRPIYERYKHKLGEQILSDKQRREFELLLERAITAKREAAAR